MKIIQFEAWPVEMRLAEPYTIAYETTDRVTNIFADRNQPGPDRSWLCGSGFSSHRGDTRVGHDRIRCHYCAGTVRLDPLRYALILERLRTGLGQQPAALAMVDMALYDLLGQIAGIPLYRLLGGYRTRIKTSITIGILSIEQTVEKARKHIAAGFRSLKMRVVTTLPSISKK